MKWRFVTKSLATAQSNHIYSRLITIIHLYSRPDPCKILTLCSYANYTVRVHLEKLRKVHQLVENFHPLYECRKFTTAFTSAYLWPLPRPRATQSTCSHLISMKSILVLCSHLRECSKWSLPNTNLYATIRQANLGNLNLIVSTIRDEERKSLSSSLCSFIHPPS